MSLTSVFAKLNGTAQDRHSYVEIPSVDSDTKYGDTGVDSADGVSVIVGNSVGTRFP